MQRPFILFTILFFISWSPLRAQRPYLSNDTLFVWAKNGLNVRLGPGTRHGIIASVPFGSKVIVQQRSNEGFNVMGIDSVRSSYHSFNKKVHPIIFKGRWVQVETDAGVIGYAIDTYLLRLQPISHSDRTLSELHSQVLSVDTVYKSPVIQDGTGLNCTVQIRYAQGIICTQSFGGVWIETKFAFPHFSIQDVLIAFSANLGNYQGFTVLRNWRKEIILTDNGICTVHIKDDGTQINMSIACSC